MSDIGFWQRACQETEARCAIFSTCHFIQHRTVSILNKEPFQLELACLSETGRVRARNEDTAAVDGEYGLALVADGMGGHRSGEVASQMALEILVKRLRSKIERFRAGVLKQTPLQFAEQIIGEANQAIHAAAKQEARYEGMGTTVALAIFHGRHAALAHVGDSRIYRLRGGRLQLLTRDDSLLCDQVEMGLIDAEDASDSHNRNMVTQALGTQASVTIHLQEEDVLSGDVFLLCTDGLSDLVEERDLELVVDSLKTNLPLAVSHLVQLANDNGGYDNITAALVRVCDRKDEPPVIAPRQSWLTRLLAWLSPKSGEK